MLSSRTRFLPTFLHRLEISVLECDEFLFVQVHLFQTDFRLLYRPSFLSQLPLTLGAQRNRTADSQGPRFLPPRAQSARPMPEYFPALFLREPKIECIRSTRAEIAHWPLFRSGAFSDRVCLTLRHLVVCLYTRKHTRIVAGVHVWCHEIEEMCQL